MPYIQNKDRFQLKPYTIGRGAETQGELNFQITELIKDYMTRHILCYATINDILGACEGAKLEFYRRVAAPYEDKKIKENGDVYPQS